MTSNELEELSSIELIIPDIVFLNIGIVDCAPRKYDRNSILIKCIERSPKSIRNRIYRFKKKHSARKVEYAYVNSADYRKNIINFIEKCRKNGVGKIILLSIPKPLDKLSVKSPKLLEQVDCYNKILKDISSSITNVQYLNVLQDQKDVNFVDDGYHLTARGHNEITEVIINAGVL